MKIVVFFVFLAVLSLTAESREYDHHLTLKPNVFDVYWSVNTTISYDKRFYFKFVAKTTGWAALGWSKTPDGSGMEEYDIALGGVRNGNESYLNDYYSQFQHKPYLDAVPKLQSLVLTNATEADGYTTIEFNRIADTWEPGNDIPIENGTRTWLMWAIAPTDATDPKTFVKHSDKDYTRVAYNMFTGEVLEASTAPPATATVSPTPSGNGTAAPPSAAINTISLVLVLVLLQLFTVLLLH